MGRGKSINEEAREIIYKVYLYCSVEAEKFKTDDGYFQKVQQRVANATGVSIKYIYSLLKEKGKYDKTSQYALKRKSDDKIDEQNESDIYSSFCLEPVPVDKIQKTNNSLLETLLTTPSDTELINADSAGPSTINVRPRHNKPPRILPKVDRKSITSKSTLGTGTYTVDSTSTFITFHQGKNIILPPKTNKQQSPSLEPKNNLMAQNAEIHQTSTSTSQSISLGPTFIQLQPTQNPHLQRNVMLKTIGNITQITNPAPTFIQVNPFLRTNAQVQQNTKPTTANTTQNINPGPAFIKVHPIPKTAVPLAVLASVPKKKIGNSLIKLYPIQRDLVAKPVTETAQNTEHQNGIEFKTVPVEFDPESFKREIKIENDTDD